MTYETPTAEVLAALGVLAHHGGDVAKSARVVGVTRRKLSRWRDRFPEDYKRLVDELTDRLLDRAVQIRAEALTSLAAGIKAKHDHILTDPKAAANLRVSDLARALEILDRFVRGETANTTADRPTTTDDLTDADADVAAILGEDGPQGPRARATRRES